jgi:D-alanyl-D-alanine carboxypeptidase/D-alanyl-D-alanine-endopeptidase (penicillin-binding protein 4)
VAARARARGVWYNRGVRSVPVNGSPRARVGRVGAVLFVAGAFLLAACSSDDDASDDPPDDSTSGAETSGEALPEDAQAIVDSEPFAHGSWSYVVSDSETGEVVHSSGADTLSFLGSTTKLFTVGAYLDEVGADATLETPVYATGTRAGGDLQGDLVLVGAGDFILGSRGVGTDGTGELQTRSPDHVYFYASPLVERVEADPLTGLDELAAQVREAGITSVSGDVLVDDRLWEPYESKEGVVTPIMVNDNVLDIAVVPGEAAGDPASVDVRPETAAFEIVNEVETVAADGDADVVATPTDDGTIELTGEIPVGADPFNTGVLAPDPAAYARGLFIEALGRAGVTVTAPIDAPQGELPDSSTYPEDTKVAALASPPASVLGALVLGVSHNRGAESIMCLLAVQAGSTDCEDGLSAMLATMEEAGIDLDTALVYDGEGSDPASATPATMIDWLEWSAEQPWGEAFRDGLPDVMDDGTIMVKSGTSARPEVPPMPSLFVVYGEAGYMTAASGRELTVAVYSSNGVYPTVAEGLDQGHVNLEEWLAAVAAAL